MINLTLLGLQQSLVKTVQKFNRMQLINLHRKNNNKIQRNKVFIRFKILKLKSKQSKIPFHNLIIINHNTKKLALLIIKQQVRVRYKGINSWYQINKMKTVKNKNKLIAFNQSLVLLVSLKLKTKIVKLKFQIRVQKIMRKSNIVIRNKKIKTLFCKSQKKRTLFQCKDKKNLMLYKHGELLTVPNKQI